jgi:peptidoglycan hydrolase CwlO-like protein
VARNASTGGEWAKLQERIKELNQALREQKEWLR